MIRISLFVIYVAIISAGAYNGSTWAIYLVLWLIGGAVAWVIIAFINWLTARDESM